MKSNIKLIEDEKLIYRYCNIKGLLNLHYNVVVITNLRVIMTYAYKPWWYYWVFILNPTEISSTTIFIKYISSMKIKTMSIFTTSLSGPFHNLFSRKFNDNDRDLLINSNNYLPKRYSLNDIIFKAFLRGLFFGSIIAVLLWKFYKVHIKILIGQFLVCILLNIIYDFYSYSPLKYLEIYTLDGIGNDNNDSFKFRASRYKRNINYNVYQNNRNSYIIEGDLNELTFLRDKIITAIKEYSSSKESSEKPKIDKKYKEKLKNRDSKTKDNDSKDKDSKNDNKNNNNSEDVDSENDKKVKKKSLMNKKQNNNDKKLTSTNKTNNNFINKKGKLGKNYKEKDNNIIIYEKSLFQKVFGLILNFIKIILFSYLSVILVLSSMYYITNMLEKSSILSD